MAQRVGKVFYDTLTDSFTAVRFGLPGEIRTARRSVNNRVLKTEAQLLLEIL